MSQPIWKFFSKFVQKEEYLLETTLLIKGFHVQKMLAVDNTKEIEDLEKLGYKVLILNERSS